MDKKDEENIEESDDVAPEGEGEEIEIIEEVEYVPFFVRFQRQIKDIVILLLIGGFYAAYHYLPFINRTVDIAVTPAVYGITVVYGKLTSFIYDKTGKDLEFVTRKRDPVFDFRVEVANYINNRDGASLIAMANDQLAKRTVRAIGLNSLTMFDTTSEWIRPFLNELPRGGLLGLYKDKAPELTSLIKQIRAEGGIRNPLERAYAEVVFSFLLRASDPVLRKHALNWVNDVLAEDAIFLIAPLLDIEVDPDVQLRVEDALWRVEAISDHRRALALLVPHFTNPQWDTLRLPLAAVLSRLGNKNGYDFLAQKKSLKQTPKEYDIPVRIALARKRYPKQLRMTNRAQFLVNEKIRARKSQYKQARKKWEKIQWEEHVKAMRLAGKEIPAQKKLVKKPVRKRKKIPVKKVVSLPRSEANLYPRKKTETLFEPNTDQASIHQEPSDRSPELGILTEGKTYAAVKSVKTKTNRWFYLREGQKNLGWVKGVNLQFAREENYY